MGILGTCKECNQEYISYEWCKACNVNHFRQNFKNWTSGNDDIDEFIRNAQLSAKSHHRISEWIPYERFYNVKFIASGGFGKIYSANWIDGYIIKWSNKIQNWEREGHQMTVALKSLNNSEDVTQEFIREITLHHKIGDMDAFIVKFYGITQDPETKNYMMVLDYADRGSLKNHLDKNYGELKWNDKLRDLWRIAVGIEKIHEKGLIHRDLHIGNILSFSSKDACITDMGLCKPANNDELKNAENSIYGVLPYIAPEVLRGKNYTKPSDIYSFGLRPKFNTNVPQLIVNLIKRCLDADPLNRPIAKEIKEILWTWRIENNLELIKQIKETEKFNSSQQRLSTSLRLSFESHSEAIYTSRLLNFGDLPSPKNSDDYYDNYGNIISTEFTESLLSVSQFSISDDAEKL
ncbi:kinase-like domain-containing protein [Rhizophagus clarus]|uniref:Kinase-like domain-containing protein n=1 Tax=Rhizophagus clarus TaxID=94130 RepID=A0A8H3LLW9_9GLOM|nr:kinase-like domain-containing protein [Rhizophagus clarus]